MNDPKTPGGIGTPDAGSLVEDTHANTVERLCFFIVFSFHHLSLLWVSRVLNTKGVGY